MCLMQEDKVTHLFDMTETFFVKSLCLLLIYFSECFMVD